MATNQKTGEYMATVGYEVGVDLAAAGQEYVAMRILVDGKVASTLTVPAHVWAKSRQSPSFVAPTGSDRVTAPRWPVWGNP